MMATTHLPVRRLPTRLRGALLGLALGSLLLSGATLAAEEPKETPAAPPESNPQQDAEAAKKQTMAKSLAPAVAAAREFQPVPGAPSPGPASAVEGEWFMEWRYSVNDTDIKGNQDRSFLHEGVNNVGEYTLLHKRPFGGIRQLEAMGLYRYTDDPRVDPEVNSFQRGYLRLTGPTFESSFGDSLVNYSRFSFNQNVKGVNAWKRLPVGSGLRLVGSGGVFQDRWGSIFKGFEDFADPRFPPDPKFPSKPYTRFVLGTRAEQYMDENSFVAFSYSLGNDDVSSLPPETQLRPIDNHVLSFDTNVRLGRDFTFIGEMALSFTHFDKRIQPNEAPDTAARFELSHRWKHFSWRADYARFSPNFFSINARQVLDLQDASLRASYAFTDDMSLEANFRYTNDNLAGDPVVVTDPATGERVVLTNAGRTRKVGGVLQVFPFIVDENGNKMTTTVRSPEVRWLVRRLPPNRSLQLSIGYRERQFETSNKGSFSASGNPLFSDRVTRMPFIDLSWSVRSSLLGLSYEYRQNRDRAKPSSSTFTNRFVASYRGTYFWGDWVVSPSFRFETEPEGRRILRTTQDLLISPLVVDFPARDQTRSYQGSLVIDFPKYFSLEALYRELNAELLSPFTVTDPLTGSPLRAFGNGGYDRPYFRAALTYKIRNKEDYLIIASFERGVNTFLSANTAAPDDRSFRENVVQLTVVIRWRR